MNLQSHFSVYTQRNKKVGNTKRYLIIHNSQDMENKLNVLW